MAAAALEPTATRPERSRSATLVQWQGILTKELRDRMRGPRAFVVLAAYLLFLSLFTLFVYFLVRLAASGSMVIPPGKIVFLALAAVQLGFVCFLAPSFTAGVISGERERQTYDLLMTTPTSLVLILTAKLLGALAYVFLLIVAALPLMSIALFLGGVAPEELLITQVMLLASALVCGAIGLCFSAWVRSTIAAAALSYGTMLLPVVVLPILFGVMASFISVIMSSAGVQNSLPFLYGAGLVYSLNPFIAGGFTEAIIATNHSLFFFSIPVPMGQGSGTFYVIGPWLIYSVSAFLASIVFFLLALYFARPTRHVGRRRPVA